MTVVNFLHLMKCKHYLPKVQNIADCLTFTGQIMAHYTKSKKNKIILYYNPGFQVNFGTSIYP